METFGGDGRFQRFGDALGGAVWIEGRAALPQSKVKAAGAMAPSARATIWPWKPIWVATCSRACWVRSSSSGDTRTKMRGWASTSRARASRAAETGASGKCCRAASAILRAQARASMAAPSRCSCATWVSDPNASRMAWATSFRAWAASCSARATDERSPSW